MVTIETARTLVTEEDVDEGDEELQNVFKRKEAADGNQKQLE